MPREDRPSPEPARRETLLALSQLDGVDDSAWLDVIAKMDEVYSQLVQDEIALEEKNAQLEQSQQFIFSLLSAMSDVLMACDEAGRIEETNAALRELVGLALAGNRDLRVAVQAIEQARAQYQVRRADQFPTLGATASGQRSAPNPYGPGVASTYSVGLGVSAWELDFFGRVAALKDVALAKVIDSVA